MSKIGDINLQLTETAERLGITSSPAEFTDAEKKAVAQELESIIEFNSCESDCYHYQMLNFVKE